MSWSLSAGPLTEAAGEESGPGLDFWLVVPLDHLRGEVLQRQSRREGAADRIQVRAEGVGLRGSAWAITLS